MSTTVTKTFFSVKPHQTDGQLCAEHGWDRDTILEDDEGFRCRIIGFEPPVILPNVPAREPDAAEAQWCRLEWPAGSGHVEQGNLNCRDWHKVA